MDLLCILEPGARAWENLLSSQLFKSADCDEFIMRGTTFRDFPKRNAADIISQRFNVIDGNFTLSAHFFPAEFFLKMNNERIENDLAKNEDVVFPVRDYKAKRFEHSECIQQGFDGSEFSYVPQQTETDNGLITTLPGYAISRGRFYPGLYQNLISPEFSVFYDATGATNRVVAKFCDIILRRLQGERAIFPEATLANSHIRNRIFAPGRYLD